MCESMITLNLHDGAKLCLAKLDGSFLASGSEAVHLSETILTVSSVRVWAVETGECVTTLRHDRIVSDSVSDEVICLAQLDGGLFASGFAKGSIKVWDVLGHVCWP